MSDATFVEVPLVGAYAERPQHEDSWLERFCVRAKSAASTRNRHSRANRVVAKTASQAADVKAMDPATLQAALEDAVDTYRADGHNLETVARCFALLREIAFQTLGKRYFDVQLIGAWQMLSGSIAEMETGEGKTLTASLAAAVAALGGTPVHVVSVNDYLVERDAEQLRPFYERFGLNRGYGC